MIIYLLQGHSKTFSLTACHYEQLISLKTDCTNEHATDGVHLSGVLHPPSKMSVQGAAHLRSGPHQLCGSSQSIHVLGQHSLKRLFFERRINEPKTSAAGEIFVAFPAPELKLFKLNLQELIYFSRSFADFLSRNQVTSPCSGFTNWAGSCSGL